MNATWRARAEASGKEHHEVRFGIGLATGECYVGNFGSSHRFDYSALGDCVNLASRLEAATKLYRTSMLTSEATRDAAPDLPWLEVDTVRVLGKNMAARVFTLVGGGIEGGGADFVALAADHERMLAAYRGGEFAAARSLAKQAGVAAPALLHGLYGAYERRWGALAQSCPADWAPVTELEDKSSPSKAGQPPQNRKLSAIHPMSPLVRKRIVANSPGASPVISFRSSVDDPRS